MDQLLRTLLQVHVVSRPATTQQAPGALGLSEIQTTETSRTESHALAGRGGQTGTTSFRSLAVRVTSCRLGNGSRMSRGGPVRWGPWGASLYPRCSRAALRGRVFGLPAFPTVKVRA